MLELRNYDARWRGFDYVRAIRRGVRVELSAEQAAYGFSGAAWLAFGSLVGRDYQPEAQLPDASPDYRDDELDQRFEFHLVEGTRYLPVYRHRLPTSERCTLAPGVHVSYRVAERHVTFHGWIGVREGSEDVPQIEYLAAAGIGPDGLNPMDQLVWAMKAAGV